MLKEILESETCAKCQICCGFNRSDIWETPIITDDTKEYMMQNVNRDQQFIRVGKANRFKMEFKDEEVIFCPMLDRETGCILGENKPFDCKIWPFRIMNAEGKLVIAVASICPSLGQKAPDELAAFLESGLADRIFKEADQNPDIVKSYTNGYPIILVKN